MEHLKSYELYEKLGINKDLEDLVELCKKELEGKTNYVVRTNYKGKDISIIFKIKEIKERLGFFTVINEEKNIFKIVINSIDTDNLSHELKHLDRTITRNYKIDKYGDYRIVNKISLKDYPFFKNEDFKEILEILIYLYDPDEFESRYVGMYHDLKKIIKENMTNEEKRNIIDKYLKNSDLYYFYNLFYNEPFKIEKFFKGNRNLNFFIKTLFNNIKKYKEENRENLPEYNKYNLLYKNISIYFKNIFLKDEKEISKFVKIFNNDINKSIRKGYRKIFRLYSIFI